jgi:adenylate cyclase, class 2
VRRPSWCVPMVEREIKLRFASADEARAAIDRLGATPYTARRLQDDALLDTDGASLQDRGCALRVRREGDDARITFKGPIIPGVMKAREEIETSIGDSERVLRILREIGFTPRFRYQKYREEFRLGSLIVALDETPVGIFVELEGQEPDIAAAATRLGRTPDDYIRASYRTLFLDYRQAHGLTAPDMLFTAS